MKAWKCRIRLKQEVHIINNQKFQSISQNTTRLQYKGQLFNTVSGNSRCLF